jgi:dihydropyrimidine dehydrogenase (NAD+) subunit PreA
VVVPGAENYVFFLSGEYLRPLAQAYVARIAQAVKVPIIGTGGVMSWRHVVEFIMFGASAVGLCTILMIEGFGILQEIEKKLEEFMSSQGYTHIEDFKGIALKYVKSSLPEVKIYDVFAKVNEELCNGCGLCTRPAHCGREHRAIKIVEKKAVVEKEQCLGCGTCYILCPVGAITMEPVGS